MDKKTHIQEDIMRRIREENITPRARFYFVTRNILLWTVGIVAALVGAMVMSAVYLSLFNTDLFLFTKLGRGPIEFILSALPLVWLLLMVVFTLLVVYEVRHTKRGYRYEVWKIVLINIVFSLLLGYVLYAQGMAHMFDHHMSRFLPAYQSVEHRMQEVWNNPERGLLSGMVLGTTTSGDYMLRDANEKVWTISISDLSEPNIKYLSVDYSVRMAGEVVATSTFVPCAVGVWSIKGEHEALRKEFLTKQVQRRSSGEMLPLGSRGPKWQMASERNKITPEVESRLNITDSERNQFRMRTIECEGMVHVPRKPGINK